MKSAPVAWFVGLLSALLALPPTHAASLTPTEFRMQMQHQIAQLAKTTTAGIYIVPLGSTQSFFTQNPDSPLVPASASKIVTTSAALEKLGSAFTYQTHVVQQGEELILVGSGDPFLVNERFLPMAQAIAKSVSHVSSIWIDNSAYVEDYEGLARFAGFDGETDAGVVSPASLNFNLLSVEVSVNAKGPQPFLTAGPSHNNYALFKNEVTQVAGAAHSLTLKSMGMEGAQEIIQVSGTMGRASPAVSLSLAVTLPEAHIAYALAGVLRDLGVKVDNDYGGVSFQPLDPAGKIVVTQPSLPLNQLANLYMTASNNFMAEQIFQTFGAATFAGQASIIKSEQAISGFLRQRAACLNAQMENGSGLTWNNQISANCFIAVMQSLTSNPQAFKDLIASFPIGGQTGTLKDRFHGAGPGFVASKVHAKTGTLWSQKAVSALIGLTQVASGQEVLFAFIENDSRNLESVTAELKGWEDRCVELVQQLHF